VAEEVGDQHDVAAGPARGVDGLEAGGAEAGDGVVADRVAVGPLGVEWASWR